MHTFKDLPFCIGALKSAFNPNNIPNVLDLVLENNKELHRIEQVNSTELSNLLTEAYGIGNEMGVPSDQTSIGIGYVRDFLEFIDRNIGKNGGNAADLLEIGAGTGFLAKSLKEKGFNVTAIEPGKGYSSHWVKNEIEVVNDFFPSDQIQQKFDAIVFYTVLEHIKDTTKFLDDVSNFLKPTGKIFLAVPDCALELYSGDPSILLHEHYQYFTEKSLQNTLKKASFSSVVEKSKYGRSIYACGEINNFMTNDLFNAIECDLYSEYVYKANHFIQFAREKLIELSKVGQVGVFSPSRALNYMPLNVDFKFYDDADSVQGKYYPPFESPVLPRASYISQSTDYLFIASRTFGKKIKSDLMHLVPNAKIILIEDLIS
jgi:2-polyprenyl-3-methyl-5-hydroxy-6-metoxy-1,4-benzoquinol methylase